MYFFRPAVQALIGQALLLNHLRTEKKPVPANFLPNRLISLFYQIDARTRVDRWTAKKEVTVNIILFISMRNLSQVSLGRYDA